jgi:hypothetical protein
MERSEENDQDTAYSALHFLMANDITQEFRYRVEKVTFSRKQCRVCGGTGKRNNKSGSNEPCLNCQNGVETVEHGTDVSLRTALLEIGIENLIRKTVTEMAAPPNSK